MYYNFCRNHMTLKKTPAMAAGVETRKWQIVDIVNMIDQYQKSNPKTLADAVRGVSESN